MNLKLCPTNYKHGFMQPKDVQQASNEARTIHKMVTVYVCTAPGCKAAARESIMLEVLEDAPKSTLIVSTPGGG